MVDKEMLEAIGQMMDSKLEPINTRLDKLEQGQAKLEAKMDKGFENLEYSINELSKDVGRLYKRFNAHIEQPIH